MCTPLWANKSKNVHVYIIERSHGIAQLLALPSCVGWARNDCQRVHAHCGWCVVGVWLVCVWCVVVYETSVHTCALRNVD